MGETIPQTQTEPLSAAGRPLRKGAGKREGDPNFVNSTEAIHDAMGDMIEEHKQIFQTLSRSKKCTNKRKRLRSLTPTPPPLSPVECLTETDLSTTLENSPAPEVTQATDSEPINLTFHIPPGFRGPLKIQIEPSMIARLSTPSPLRHTMPYAPHIAKRLRYLDEQPTKSPRMLKSKRVAKFVKQSGHDPRGFCELPAELRNVVYRAAFVSREVIDFGSPRNCERSAAFLRTCRMVHAEGSSILYSENRFTFRRAKYSRNPFWRHECKELGYFDMRHFLTMIGEMGRGYLRKIHIVLDDATRHHSIHLSDGDGRFTHDANLLECLKIIARNCYLRKLALTFFGRRNLTTYDVRFLENICSIEVDELVFNPDQNWGGDKIEPRVREVLETEMIRPDPMFETKESKKKLIASIGRW